MCKREMTLGEEIIGLTARGIDIPTVERMYRKYIEMAADIEPEKFVTFVNTTPRAPFKSDFIDAEVGDKLLIELDGLGVFAATIHKVTDDKIMFIFDDYVTKRPMNKSNTNNGGFEASDLNDWLYSEFIKKLPRSINTRLTKVTIPSIGEMFGWDDEWDRDHIRADGDKQLPLMKQIRNRVGYCNNKCASGWLRNAMKESYSEEMFVLVNDCGESVCSYASNARGVRPEIWLAR